MDLEQKILVTGFNGQLGFDCVRELISRGYDEIYAPSREELDITSLIVVVSSTFLIVI